jgi:hypothetical protein
MVLTICLFVPHCESDAVTGLESRLNEICNDFEIDCQVVHLGPQDNNLETSSFQKRIDLGKETNSILDNQQLEKISRTNHIYLPQTHSGYLTTFLLIYRDGEPLIFYPQHGKSTKWITIDDFLDALREKREVIIIFRAARKVIEVMDSELEMYDLTTRKDFSKVIPEKNRNSL